MANRYLYFARSLSEIDPIFDECGEWCGEQDEPLDGYCDGCQMKDLQDGFQEDCVAWLEHRVRDGSWKRYGLQKLIAAVLDAQRAEDLPPADVSAKTGKMIAALHAERNRLKRIDAWNEKTKAQSE